MSGSYASTLALSAATVLVCAVAAVWLTSLRAVIRSVGVQGVGLGAVALILGIHLHDAGLIATAGVVLVVKAGVIPFVLGKATTGPLDRERRPLLNVPASLVASAALILVAFGATRSLASFVGTTAGTFAPVGIAAVLLGFLVLVSRRRPILQIVGLLLVDNGIALVAFLCTAGVPFLIELGVSLDVLLGVGVLLVLVQRMRADFGDLDLDDLRELAD
jgi:hydrogenase-4 component E